MSLYKSYSNFQKNFENEPKNSTYFIEKLNTQFEEEYCPEILGGFRAINEYSINDYSEQNNDLLNDNNYESFVKYFKKPENEAWGYTKPHFYNKNTEEINEKTEINIKNYDKIRFDLFNIFENSNTSFSSTNDDYNLENIISINNNFSNINFFSINSNKEKKKKVY